MKLVDGEARVVLGVARTATEPPNVRSSRPSVIIVAKWATSKVFVIVRSQEVAEVRVTNLEG